METGILGKLMILSSASRNIIKVNAATHRAGDRGNLFTKSKSVREAKH